MLACARSHPHPHPHSHPHSHMAVTEKPNRVTIPLPGDGSVSGLLDLPPDPKACYVFAHGAGAGMHHSFMSDIAAGLVARNVAVLRYQFPYMEQGSRRPDTPKVAHHAVRSAVAFAARRVPGVPLFAGGKSYGGRMTSQAHSAEPLPGVVGLLFIGFPLHPAGKPSVERAAHLDAIEIPMLFLQGTRDTLAELGLVREVMEKLGTRATLHVVEGGDHSFHVLARSGRTDAEVRTELVDTAVAWMMQR